VLFGAYLSSLAVISGIRWTTGTDWDSYLSFYESGGSFSDYMSYAHFEPGFKAAVWGFHSAGLPYSIWLFSLTALVLLIQFLPIFRRPYLLICLLVLFGSAMADLFPTRESLSVSIIILSAYFLVEKRFFLYVACVILAALFHTTALIFLAAPLIYKMTYRALTVCAVLFGILLKLVLYSVAIVVATYLGLANLLTAAELYLDTVGGRISLPSILQKSLILLFSFFVLSKCRDRMTRFELISVKLMYFGIITSIFLESASQIFNRLTAYFVSFEFIAASSLIYFYSKYLIKKRSYLTLLTVYVGVCLVYAVRFCALLATYPDLYYPFETIFQSAHRTVY
jgi:hypothetical protein